MSIPKEGIAAHSNISGHQCLGSCRAALLHAVNGGIVIREVSRFTMDVRKKRVISKWQSVVASCCCSSLVTDDSERLIFVCRCLCMKTSSGIHLCSCIYPDQIIVCVGSWLSGISSVTWMCILHTFPFKVNGNERSSSDHHELALQRAMG